MIEVQVIRKNEEWSPEAKLSRRRISKIRREEQEARASQLDDDD